MPNSVIKRALGLEGARIEGESIIVSARPRRRAPRCPVCGRRCDAYDTPRVREAPMPPQAASGAVAGLRFPRGSVAPLTGAWRPCGSPWATSRRGHAPCSRVRVARTSTPHHHPRTRTKEQQPICRSGVRAAARNRPGLRTSTSRQAVPRAEAVYAKRREGQTA